jgi:hypothetical protein
MFIVFHASSEGRGIFAYEAVRLALLAQRINGCFVLVVVLFVTNY